MNQDGVCQVGGQSHSLMYGMDSASLARSLITERCRFWLLKLPGFFSNHTLQCLGIDDGLSLW